MGINLGGSIPILGDIGKVVRYGGMGIGFLGLVTKAGRHADDVLDLSRTIRPAGKGWTLRSAGDEGRVVYRAWGGTGPEVSRWWSPFKSPTGRHADELFNLRSHGNTAEYLTTGLVRPGMPYWERFVLGM